MISAAMACATASAANNQRDTLLLRSDLMYCLAQTFLPPPAAWSVCDWAQPLIDDLRELGAALALDTEPVCAALESECQRWAVVARQSPAEADSWLVEYARLFLVPPVPVTLNAGVYLEGALGGAVAQMASACYALAGVEPDERFHDLPDHVAMQLEFVARLLERAARDDADAAEMADEFCAEFVHVWAEPLQVACERAAQRWPAARVYVELVRLMRRALHDPSVS